MSKTKSIRLLSVVLSSAALMACSFDEPSGPVQLQPNELRVYTFASDTTMMVSFTHGGDADTALACQGKRPDPIALPLPNCAGVYESDGEGILPGGNSAEGLHGAGVSFEPKDGSVIVALKNISKIPLSLSIKAEPIN